MSETTELEPLTLHDLVALVMFWPYLEQHARVKWIDSPDDDLDDIRVGTIRHLVRGEDDDGFLTDQDVRMAYVRLTSTTGGEIRRPLMEFAKLFTTGMAALAD